VAALWVHHENLPVEVEKRIESRIAPLRRRMSVIILKQHTQAMHMVVVVAPYFVQLR